MATTKIDSPEIEEEFAGLFPFLDQTFPDQSL